MNDKAIFSRGLILLRSYAILLIVIGMSLAVGGLQLLQLDGSPYYLLFGISVFAAGILLWLRRAMGVLVYGAMLLVTIAWAIWEAGGDGWALMARVLAPSVLGLVMFIPGLRRCLVGQSLSGLRVAVGLALAVAIGAGLRSLLPPYIPADPMYQAGVAAPSTDVAAKPTNDSGDWLNYGNDPGGTRFSGLAQITPANVGRLRPAWTFRVGDTGKSAGFETTPLKVGGALYLCNSRNDVFALDAETGKLLWKFDAHVDLSKALGPTCRGIAYYKAPNAVGACAERIVTNTVDVRLIAIDARDGKRCPDFGANGEVSLLTGLGKVEDGYYYVTSAPTIAQGRIVLGGWVADNQYWGEPSGVIRAFEATTGKLAWAFDAGRPDRQTVPPDGETYTPATPNSWGPMSADETLGLVYVPTGNATPDYFGGQRRPFDDQYSSAVIALDIKSGKPRWVYQTAHHDLWDYDVGAQPTLTDIPTPRGTVPAVIVPSKRGEVFILDRRTGLPLNPVKERAVPQRGAVPEERVAPTQPYPTGVPSFRGADLTERDMWGITPLDQLWCRIKFRQARYDGPMTPPGLTPSIQYPFPGGGMDWGGAAIDASRHIVILNSNYLPFYVQLFPRAEADKRGWKRSGHGRDFGPEAAQAGTPYAVSANTMMSPLEVPCLRPPFGRLSAVDLTTGKLIWSIRFGTARDSGPLEIPSLLPIPLGTPNFGGAVVTHSGLTFISATQERMFRAYETITGKELWRARLPAGGQATPITYLSPASGRQFVVIAAGGHGILRSKRGDYILAYALPNAGTEK